MSLCESTYSVTELEGRLRYDGRVTFLPDRVGIDWTNSGFAFRARCRGEVRVRLEPADLPNYSYVIGLLDRESLSVEQLKARRIRVDHPDDYVLLSDVPEGEHEIRLVKITEAQVGIMDFLGLSLCGELLEPPAAGKWKIGFIGDSLTGGLHNLCRNEDPNPVAQDNEDGYHAFDGFTARYFDADIHVVSLSGWGVVCGWGEPRRDYSVPRAFLYTSFYRNDKEDGLWDFTDWQPDALVINLGSNDSSSTDDDPAILSDEEFRDKTVEFLRRLRGWYPHARIVWALGMAGLGKDGRIGRLVEEAIARRACEGEEKVSFLLLPKNQEGGNMHPTVEGHEKAAAVLCAELEKWLKDE